MAVCHQMSCRGARAVRGPAQTCVDLCIDTCVDTGCAGACTDMCIAIDRGADMR